MWPQERRQIQILVTAALQQVVFRVDGVHVAGKTGTAEWTSLDGRDLTYASFIGVADLPSRRIVALVGIAAPPRDDGNDHYLGGPAAAYLKQATGSWTAVFIVVAVLDAVTALLAITVLKSMRQRHMIAAKSAA